VAKQALAFSQRARFVRSALVNGAAGVVADTGGQLLAVMGFTVRRGKILEIDILADPARLRSTYQSRTPDADPDPAMTSLRTTRLALHRAVAPAFPAISGETTPAVWGSPCRDCDRTLGRRQVE
jgi:hypothetical protein